MVRARAETSLVVPALVLGARMLTYYVTLYRTAEHGGTTTSSAKGVYQLRAWNSDEALKAAHARIQPGATYEYLVLSRAAPRNPEEVVVLP